jgi:5S rRNA maturation endonuclease (ribonuclease M5)
MDSDRPGMLIRKHLMQLLSKHGEAEVHRAMKVVTLRQAA